MIGSLEAVGPNTRAILLNNPHNPTGRLFGAGELETVASVAREHDLIVISDEVWEHVLLDGRQFTPLATLPGMSERTIKIGSAGKIFSLTGWKVGWMVAAPELANVIARAHQFLTFSTAPNLQTAVAFGLDEGDRWLGPMRARFERARDRMTQGLRGAGYAVLDGRLDLFPVRRSPGLRYRGGRRDVCRRRGRAGRRRRRAALGLRRARHARHLVRLCFGKKDETIDAGVAAMAKAKELFR